MKKKNKNVNQDEAVMESTAAPAKKKKKKKKAPIIVSLIVIVVLVVWMVSCAMKPAPAAIVTTTQATRGDLQEIISTSGMVASEETEVIFAPVAGTLGEVKVAAGDAVKKGDVLVNYDMTQMERTLQEAALQQQKNDATYTGAMSDNSKEQAKLNEATTNLSVLEQQIKDNKSYLKDLQNKLSQNKRDSSTSLADESYNLNNKSAELQNQLAALDPTSPDYASKEQSIKGEMQSVSAEISRNSYLQSIVNSTDYVVQLEQEIADVQERITDYETYKSRMESQKTSSEATVLDSYDKVKYDADKQLAELSYQQTEENYYEAKKGVCAEFDGIVTECTAVSGASVTNGVQLLTLASSSNVKITFSASKYDLEKLAIGQKATITISGNTYEGEVSKINRMATVNASNTPMVGVEIHIVNPDDKIILGLDAKMVIDTNKTENALLIPVEAINADKEGDFLYVVENGVAVRKPVVCGISSDTMTEIKEGITEDDQIIVSAYTTIEDGMAVTAMPVQ